LRGVHDGVRSPLTPALSPKGRGRKTAPRRLLSSEERGKKNNTGPYPLPRGARKKKQRRAVPSSQRSEEGKQRRAVTSARKGEAGKTAPDHPLSPEERGRKNSAGLSPLPCGERVRGRGNL